MGRKADGWLPSLGVLTRDELRAGNQQIDAAAEKAGRDLSSGRWTRRPVRSLLASEVVPHFRRSG